jgi:eukaryotic-like serine/threonine-protein kinase
VGLLGAEKRHRREGTVASTLEKYQGRFPDLVERLLRVLQKTPARPGGNTDAAAGLDLRAYALLDRVGAGGMGEVFRGRDPALGRDLAVKVLGPDLRGNQEAERRFEQEARITGALQHPNIVPVHNLGRLPNGRLYFTMKLVRGRTLARILTEDQGPEQLPALLAIFEKVCQAVAFAHSRGVIHRDLKPANVMVGAFGEVQVMDWGLAKILPTDRQARPRAVSERGDGSPTWHAWLAEATRDDRQTGVVGTPPTCRPSKHGPHPATWTSAPTCSVWVLCCARC